jgi:hypothetical protein
MPRGGDRRKPPIHVYLKILAQFSDAEAKLDGATAGCLTGVSCSTARDCLAEVFGFGSQSQRAQLEGVEANHVSVIRSLGNPNLLLVGALKLSTRSQDRSRWLSIVVRWGRIGEMFYAVVSVTGNPARGIAWLRSRDSRCW